MHNQIHNSILKDFPFRNHLIPQLLSLLMLFISFCSYSQDVGTGQNDVPLPQITPPSPEAAALLEFNLAKVDEYTGAASVSIPITSISKGTLQVPISLGYRATGLQVNQVASRVGFGWSLNAGGVIARTIMGKPDEAPNAFFSDYINQSAIYHADGSINFGLACNVNNNTGNFFLFNELASGNAGMEADTYSYSLPSGKSGRFIFDRHRQLRKFEVDELQIDNPFLYSTVSPQAWTITDNQGNRYIFRQTEQTNVVSGCALNADGSGQHPSVYSAWHLSEIIAANGQDKVFFDYVIEEQEYFVGVTATHYEHFALLRSGDAQRKQGKACRQWQELLTPVLSRIRTTWGQEVEFVRGNTLRQDLQGTAYPLEKVITYQHNQIVSEFEFVQSYFQAQGIGATFGDSGPKSYRLKLDQLIQKGAQGQGMPPYTFHYINQGNFPSRLSSAQDYWGFYNGAENTTLIPLYGEEHEGLIFADRFPRTAFTQVGMLSQIDYPNGGSVNLEYEQNDIPNDEGKPLREREDRHLVQSVEGTNSLTFTINSPTGQGTVVVDYTNSFSAPPTNSEGNPNNPNPVIDDPDGSMGYVQMVISSNDVGNTNQTFLLPDKNNAILSLPNGSYTARITIVDQLGVSGPCRMDLKWYSYGLVPTNWPIGGLRVKKKVRNNGIGETIQTRYRYELPNENGKSSGKHFQRLSFTYNEYGNDGYNVNGSCTLENRWRYKVLQSSTLQALGIGNGGHIGYSVVEQFAITADENQTPLGKTVSHFSNNRITRSSSPYNSIPNNDVFIGSSGYYSLSELADLQNGKLIKQEVYQNDPIAGLKLQQINEYQYQQIGGLPEQIYNMKVRVLESSGCLSCDYTKFEYSYYFHQVESRFLLTNEINKVFDDAGNALETRKVYTYDPIRSLVKQIDTYNSVNDQLSTQYTYPYELAATGNVHEKMVNKNMVTQPVKTTTLKNANILQEQRTAFKEFNQQLLPTGIYTSRTGQPEELRLQYHAYDDFGNPLEFSKANGAHTSIIWDAAGLRPIAKVVNANRDEVWYSSFEEDVNATVGGRTGKQSKNGYLVSVPNLPIGTYVLSYWRKTGNQWDKVEQEFTLHSTGYATHLPGIIDEVRIHPKDAQMTSITYDELGRVSHECDANGQFIEYSYDQFGRLQSIKDEKGNVLKAYSYHYHNE
ncbi:MAG: RHS repeat domain-containing protein [Flammeovirgaceae bacterium]